jgi:hypothetical protein
LYFGNTVLLFVFLLGKLVIESNELFVVSSGVEAVRVIEDLTGCLEVLVVLMGSVRLHGVLSDTV